MFDDFQPELLLPEFLAHSSPKRRDELSRQCRAKVVEWRWASGDMAFAFRQPFFNERSRSRAKWLKDGTEPKSGDLRHGLDADGIIHVVEEPRAGGKFKPMYVIYGENTIELLSYTEGGDLYLLRRRVYDGARLVRDHFLGDGHGAEHRFEWNGDRLEGIVGLGWNHELRLEKTRSGSKRNRLADFDPNSHTKQWFEYDELDRLARIVERTVNTDGSIDEELPPRVEYQRPRKNESIPQLAKEIERRLMEQIPAAVERTRGRGPFYCLFLCYCQEDFGAGWPPSLVLKTEAERRRIIERGDEVTYYLWAADESEDANVRVPLREESLHKHCELHYQLMDAKEDYSSAKKALRNVAKALNEIDWSNIIDVTHDFVVAAVDNTGEVDFATDIKASIPAQKFRAFKKSGLI